MHVCKDGLVLCDSTENKYVFNSKWIVIQHLVSHSNLLAI